MSSLLLNHHSKSMNWTMIINYGKRIGLRSRSLCSTVFTSMQSLALFGRDQVIQLFLYSFLFILPGDLLIFLDVGIDQGSDFLSIHFTPPVVGVGGFGYDFPKRIRVKGCVKWPSLRDLSLKILRSWGNGSNQKLVKTTTNLMISLYWSLLIVLAAKTGFSAFFTSSETCSW